MYRTKFNKPLVPGIYDKDADGNSNDNYKHNLFARLLSLQFGDQHKTLAVQKQKNTNPISTSRIITKSEKKNKNEL